MKKILLLLLFFESWFMQQPAAAQSCTGTGTLPVTVENCSATATPETPFVTVSPNPAADVLLVKNAGKTIHFQLFDLLGHKLLEQTVYGGTAGQINTGHLPAGIYLANWYDESFQHNVFTRIEITR